MYVSTKIIPVETVPGIRVGWCEDVKEGNVGVGKFKYNVFAAL
jgi:hypothetical protein